MMAVSEVYERKFAAAAAYGNKNTVAAKTWEEKILFPAHV